MRFATWNVNGLRAAWDKGLSEYIQQSDADIISIQETKMNTSYNELDDGRYTPIWNHAERKGYSGTLCLTRQSPSKILFGLDNAELDTEGRVITLRYPKFYLVNAYIPNSQGGLNRWYYRLAWDEAFYEYIDTLKKVLPVVICGDFNVAHQYIDVYPENLRNDECPSGFKAEEREGLDRLLDNGFVDCFRHLHPKAERAYSWWSNRLNKRSENRGWRIDYFLVSEIMKDKIQSVEMRSEVMGSDHCPVELVLEL